VAKEKEDSMKVPVAAGQLCRKVGMNRQNYYKGRRAVDSGLVEQLV
jgi:hypothetical protein